MASKQDIWKLSANKKINDTFEIMLSGGHSQDKSMTMSTKTKEYFIKPEIKVNYMKDSYFIVGGDMRRAKRKFEKKVLVNGKNTYAPDDTRDSNAIYITNTTTTNTPIGEVAFNQGFRFEKVKYKYGIKKYGSNWALKEIIPKNADYQRNKSYNLGVNYLYSATGNTYFNYTRANRTPTIQEAQYWSGPVKTQKNDIFELGIRDYISNTSISAALIYDISHNEVYYNKITNSANMNFKGKVARKGAQLSLIHYLDKLTLRENISYLNARIKDGEFSGKTFAGVPTWTVNLGATYKFTKELSAGIDGYYQSSKYAQDDFANYFTKRDSYKIVNLNVDYAMENGLELYAGVRNLFKEKYAQALVSTRSTWGAGPRVVYYPANGRSIYVGLKYNF